MQMYLGENGALSSDMQDFFPDYTLGHIVMTAWKTRIL